MSDLPETETDRALRGVVVRGVPLATTLAGQGDLPSALAVLAMARTAWDALTPQAQNALGRQAPRLAPPPGVGYLTRWYEDRLTARLTALDDDTPDA